MMKKIIAAVCALALIFALCACGSAKTETTTTESGEAVWKIGAIGPLTGGAAIYGNAAINGAQIAVDEINAAGGINGYQIEYYPEDDAHDAESSVNAFNTLVDKGVQLICGPVTSTPATAVASVANEARVFCLTPSASSPDVTASGDNMYQVCFTDPNQGKLSAAYVSDHMPDAKVAIIYKNDDVYSQGIRDMFIQAADANAVEVVYEGTFTEDTQTDFSVQIAAAQAAEADLVFLPIYYTPASVILKQASDIGYAPTFFGVDGMDGILTMENFDTTLAEGVMLLTPFAADATDDLTVNFVKTYNDKYGETPNQFAADGYDVIYAMKAAIENQNLTPDMDTAAICDGVIAGMQAISYDGLTGQNMTWSSNGEVDKAPIANIIKNGEYVKAE